MARQNKKIYRKKNPVKIILYVLLSLLIAFIIFAVSVFFGFKKYIVYDADGDLHLEIPMLSDTYEPDSDE